MRHRCEPRPRYKSTRIGQRGRRTPTKERRGEERRDKSPSAGPIRVYIYICVYALGKKGGEGGEGGLKEESFRIDRPD